jgi:hypothetical protein
LWILLTTVYWCKNSPEIFVVSKIRLDFPLTIRCNEANEKTLFSLQTRIEHLSQIHAQKYLLTMILTCLVLSYGVFFFQWLQGFSGQPQFVGGKGASGLVPQILNITNCFQTKVEYSE